MSRKRAERTSMLTRDRRTHDRWMHRDRFALQALKREAAAVLLADPKLQGVDLIQIELGDGSDAEFAVHDALGHLVGRFAAFNDIAELQDLLAFFPFYSTEIDKDYLASVEADFRQTAKSSGRRVGDLANEFLVEFGVVLPFPECFRDGPRARGERRAVFLAEREAPPAYRVDGKPGGLDALPVPKAHS